MEMQTELNNVWIVAVKEFTDNVRSKRFILIGIFYLAIALICAAITVYLYSLTKGDILPGMFTPAGVFSFMGIFNSILALLSLVIAADSISIEKKDRTIYQLLAKPVERCSVLLGKFIGCTGVVALFFSASAVLAYVLTIGLTGVLPASGEVVSVVEGIIGMVLLLAVYVAIALLVSTVTRNTLISVIGAIMAWAGLMFLNMLGNIVGMASMSGQPMGEYPLYANVLKWLDPMSHNVMDLILSGQAVDASGLPLWANVVILVAYMGILLLVSIEIFNRMDL
jgi:ABC-2 type transport system permease protein